MSESESLQQVAPKSNIPEFSVAELAQSLKRTIEDQFGRVRVRGELSRVSVAASGHMYSSLKDENAVIDAVCWKGTMAKLSVRPEEGLEVICTGRLTTYPKSSKYQLVIESMELAGEGALLKMLEERKKKLAAEGLFDAERKQELPFLPQVIGVVTSPTGAVIRDILHRLRDRFPRHVLVAPVTVQGDKAAAQIAAAITGFDSIKPGGLTPRPDLIIVARGGGSLEDLMAFNEEIVVRAAAQCSIPLISAVGHETDTTLIDYAADRRAPTPTGAAEMAVPVREQLVAQILECEQRLVGAMVRKRDHLRERLDSFSRALGNPARMMEVQNQKLDYAGQRLGSAFGAFIGIKRQIYTAQAAKLAGPKHTITAARQNLGHLSMRLMPVMRAALKEKNQKLTSTTRLLEGLSFERVLERGFAVVRSADGAIISKATMLDAGQIVDLQFKGNEKVGAVIGARVAGGANAKSDANGKPISPRKSKKPKAKKNNTDQGSLF